MSVNDILTDDMELFSDIVEHKADFIPLISEEDDVILSEVEIPNELAVLPLRGNVLYPGVILPITANRPKSTKLCKEMFAQKQNIGVIAQHTQSESPEMDDLYKVGTVARILKTLEMPDGHLMVILQGIKRFTIEEITQQEPYIRAKVSVYSDITASKSDTKTDKAMLSIKEMYAQVLRDSTSMPKEIAFAIKNIESPKVLLNFVASHLELDVEEKQEILELNTFKERADIVLKYLSRALQLIDVKNQIQNKVKTDLDKQQRDYLLTQQLKTIQEELGGAPGENEILELEEKASKKKWSAEVEEKFYTELDKLRRIHIQSPDYSVQLNYLNVLVDLPWNECTKDNLDMKHARKVLDKDHFGMEKIKERILEYLSVLKLKGDMKSPILCLVGPPGVGKTSLGKSIASALNRKYVRMALGGLRDEAEIRGHRKTYIGAMPGRVIQNIRKAKSGNSVFVLDEIDKVMGMSANGDPSSALLEVLDPEQNTAFHDNYLEVDYDLSKVMFIATANTLSTIHPALRDRMEIIDISGYITEEKLEIAKRHLIPKQLEEHGLKKKSLVFSDKVIEKIIEDYTRESGVRQLEKTIAKVVRNRAVLIASDEAVDKKIQIEDLKPILGLPLNTKEDHLEKNHIGVVTGLAWTAVGGEILFIETSLSKGKGNITLTGNLGDVMKESATLAYEYMKSHAGEFGIDAGVFENNNVHIHVPAGATPKDGPSAGISMFTALVSAYTKRAVKSDVAMTGEITLRGKVTPIGGVREKILAAKRAKLKEIILSVDNQRDVEDIPDEYLKGLKFHYIREMKEVVPLALEK